MRRFIQLLVPLALAASLALAVGCQSANYDRALPVGAQALLPLPDDWKTPQVGDSWTKREQLAPALELSIGWLRRPHAKQFFPQAGMDHARVLASCVRLLELLESAADPDAFQRAFESEFEVFVSAGWDGRGGGVLFTAYYTPIFEGAATRSDTYRFPLYARPDDLDMGDDGQPYPSRRAIERFKLLEGRDLELAWLRDPLDAYLCHVQGSAIIEFVDGRELRLGYGGTNGLEYTSLGRELIADGRIGDGAHGVPAIRDWARKRPEEVERYLHRNARFTFFTPISGTPHGSLDMPVSALMTLATDKSVFPRAAPVFVEANLSTGLGSKTRALGAILLDQDTGGGIRTAGRADIYVGVGDEAGAIAGRTASEGQLYYLMLRQDLVPLYAR